MSGWRRAEPSLLVPKYRPQGLRKQINENGEAGRYSCCVESRGDCGWCGDIALVDYWVDLLGVIELSLI